MIISVLSSLKAQADELRQIKRMFNHIDINKDGSLTIDELR
jgi:Ca2+-binding EF-hand superfamily protein